MHLHSYKHVLFSFLLFWDRVFLFVTALAVPELHLQTRVTLYSQRSACLCLLKCWDQRRVNPTTPSFLDLFIHVFSVYKCFVFRRTRKGNQISLQMVVSYRVAAGNWTQDLWESSQVLLTTEPRLQPHTFFLIKTNSLKENSSVLL